MTQPITIPIMMTFNQGYYIPAGVAMHSMLTHAARSREGVPLFYKIHALVQGLNQYHMDKLQETLMPFASFARLEFCDLDDTRHQTPDTRHQTPDTRHQTPDTRHQTPLP